MTHKSAARFRTDAVFSPRRPYSEPPTILNELIAVLAPHPNGLRRWSVMRAIRDIRNKDSRAVSLKFEIEVERVFRAACSNCPEGNGDPMAPFFRPEGKAGEVWAVHAHALAQDNQEEDNQAQDDNARPDNAPATDAVAEGAV